MRVLTDRVLHRRVLILNRRQPGHFPVGDERRRMLEDDAIGLHFDLRLGIPFVGLYQGLLELMPELF